MDGRELLARIGGASFLLFIPMLIGGTILYSRIGISSQSGGREALERIAAAGATFPVMNALFHLGALLLLPGAWALVAGARGDDRGSFLPLGAASLLLAVAIGAGFVFAMNHGLYRIAAALSEAPADRQAAIVVAAEMNLRTQIGAELVQSLALGVWVLCTTSASATLGWPSWLAWLGVAGGLGFIAAGLSSVLLDVPVIGMTLAGVGALGLVLFACWLVATGVLLVQSANS